MTARGEAGLRGWPVEGRFRYGMSGLDGVYLRGGVTRHPDDGYGEGISIADTGGLHVAILTWLASVRRPLLGAEARFLRKHLERPMADMALMMGLTDRELGAMEKARDRAVPGPVDRLLRLVALDAVAAADDVTRDLERTASSVRGPGTDRVASFSHDGSAWRLDWTGANPPWDALTG